MKKTTMKNFAGLTYVTIINIPLKSTAYGDVIDLKAGELERLVALVLIKDKILIRGAEFRVLKSAIGLSNETIANKLGISRNTVLKWGREVEKRLPPPYEMLVRLLVAELLGIKIKSTIDSLKANGEARKILLKAA